MRARLLVKLVAVAFVTVLVMELGLRVLMPMSAGLTLLLYQSTVPTRWGGATTLEELLRMTTVGFKPNRAYADFIANSKGFRTREHAYTKPPGTIRILTLGDSFTHASGGVPHDDLWPNQVERALQASTGHSVEVVNLGISGVATDFQIRLWQLEASRLDADVVVLAFFVGNDFFDGRDGALPESAIDRYSRQSLVVRAVRNVYRLRGVAARGVFATRDVPEGSVGGIAAREVMDGFVYEYDPMQPTLTEDAYLGMELSHAQICNPTALDQAFPLPARSLEDFYELVSASGSKLLVMLIPAAFQVDRVLYAELQTRFGAFTTADNLNLPQRRLMELFERRGIEYVDLLPAFQETPGPLYRKWDGHWNVAGNTLAARQLVPHLVRMLGIPGSV